MEASTKEKVDYMVNILKEYGSLVTAKNIQSLYMEKGYTKEMLNNLEFKGDE